MRKIQLKCALEFGGRADFAIIDITDGSAKKRGTITIDYAPSDVEQLKASGLNFEGAMDYYKSRVYDLVRHYISGDWESAGGCSEALKVIAAHVEPQYK